MRNLQFQDVKLFYQLFSRIAPSTGYDYFYTPCSTIGDSAFENEDELKKECKTNSVSQMLNYDYNKPSEYSLKTENLLIANGSLYGCLYFYFYMWQMCQEDTKTKIFYQLTGTPATMHFEGVPVFESANSFKVRYEPILGPDGKWRYAYIGSIRKLILKQMWEVIFSVTAIVYWFPLNPPAPCRKHRWPGHFAIFKHTNVP